MQQAHIFISGHVQGVGYRQFVKQNARRLGMTGWVRNTDDRRVEAVLHADEAKVNELVKLCEKGPMLSEVKDVSVVWEEADDTFDEFKIIL